jgi:PAS domain-containing protein
MNQQDLNPEKILKQLQETETKFQKTEEELGYLKSIIEYTEDAIVGIGLDGTILTWNPGAEMIYGYTSQEAVGNS